MQLGAILIRAMASQGRSKPHPLMKTTPTNYSKFSAPTITFCKPQSFFYHSRIISRPHLINQTTPLSLPSAVGDDGDGC